ncbi:MAG: DUF4835 family protein [Cyclobacteriaceae bacterium]|nr:DUF4835 family protein [Cyclobacteriaceae bacterium]
MILRNISSNISRLVLLVVSIASLSTQAQELNCNVVVNVGPQVETTERRVFTDMETAFFNFLNSRRWTNDVFTNDEKINCNLIITIESRPTVGNFTASVQIQSSRPVFNTNYESLVFNFADRDWQFEYVESQPLEFNDNNYTSNITSMLAFYAYVIIGLDYDSFEKLGGTPYFLKAQQTVNNTQQANRPGWSQFEGNFRNRFWLSENLNSQQLIAARESLYKYHRLALDKFSENPEEARTLILEVLRELQQAQRRKPNSILVISFFDAKNGELASMFSQGNIQVRREAYEIAKQLDPSNTTKYEAIIRN